MGDGGDEFHESYPGFWMESFIIEYEAEGKRVDKNGKIADYIQQARFVCSRTVFASIRQSLE
jgi:hypothetical protein